MAPIPRFTPGYRLVDGSQLNLVVDQVNDITGNGTPQPGNFTTITAGGAITPNGGIASTGRFRYATVPIGSVAYSSFGTNKTIVAGSIYWADIYLPRNFTPTGIGILNGATVGTNSGVVAIYSSSGTLISNSNLAGATTVGASAFQQYAFVNALALVGPARYWLAYQANGATDTIRTVAASTFIDVLTTSATGAFGTLTALTPPTTFTADVGPIAYLY